MSGIIRKQERIKAEQEKKKVLWGGLCTRENI